METVRNNCTLIPGWRGLMLQRGRLSMETVSGSTRAPASSGPGTALQRGRLSMETVSYALNALRSAGATEASTRPTLDGDGERAPGALVALGGKSFNEADSRWRR